LGATAKGAKGLPVGHGKSFIVNVLGTGGGVRGEGTLTTSPPSVSSEKKKCLARVQGTFYVSKEKVFSLYYLGGAALEERGKYFRKKKKREAPLEAPSAGKGGCQEKTKRENSLTVRGLWYKYPLETNSRPVGKRCGGEEGRENILTGKNFCPSNYLLKGRGRSRKR